MRAIILLLLTFLFGCVATSEYNRPFINTDETLKLIPGLSHEEVLENIGTPLFVESGNDSMETWVYEVRVEEVRARDVPMTSPHYTETKAPVKSSSSRRVGEVDHRLKLVFKYGVLSSWGRYQIIFNRENSD